MPGRIPPPHVPLVDDRGLLTPAWYRFFAGSERLEPGEVQTGAGLTGGGSVSQGIEIAIEDHGVGDTQLREGLACSVIGRFLNSEGPVADIQAVANYRVLMRDGDQLVFRQIVLEPFTVATVPDAALAGAGTLIYVSNEAGGATPVFSDGTDWRRTTDLAVMS